jgi:hypothetical protein
MSEGEQLLDLSRPYGGVGYGLAEVLSECKTN